MTTHSEKKKEKFGFIFIFHTLQGTGIYSKQFLETNTIWNKCLISYTVKYHHHQHHSNNNSNTTPTSTTTSTTVAAIKINYIRENIDNTQQNGKCGLCGGRDETVIH